MCLKMKVTVLMISNSADKTLCQLEFFPLHRSLVGKLDNIVLQKFSVNTCMCISIWLKVGLYWSTNR